MGLTRERKRLTQYTKKHKGRPHYRNYIYALTKVLTLNCTISSIPIKETEILDLERNKLSTSKEHIERTYTC